MFYYVLKVVVSAMLIVAISEVAKRSTSFAALIAAIPITSLLAFIWLYFEGAAPLQIAELSAQIFWLVLPSLGFFLLFPVLLRVGVEFWLSFSIAMGATIIIYLALLPLLRRVGVAL